MFKIKGSVLIISCEIAKKLGPENYQRFISQLNLKYSTPTISPYKWYGLDPEERENLLIDLAAQMFPGDSLAVRKLGALQVRESTKNYQLFFLRVASPKIVFDRAIKVWETFYDTGEFELDLVNKKTIILHIRKFPEMPQYLREIIYGNLEGLGMMIKRSIIIVHDYSNPDDYQWQVEWK